MTKEIFIDEWIYRPHASKREGKKLYLTSRIPLVPFQIYVVKLYKLVISKKEDYNELMQVMKNLRPKDREMILSYIKKFRPGDNKISNVEEDEE